MKVTLIDKNLIGLESVIESLSLCRMKDCTFNTVIQCITAKPEPHMSALEQLWFKFRVEGLSKRIRAQNERHRMLSTMELSARHVNLSDVDFIVPKTAKNPEWYNEIYEYIRKKYEVGLTMGEDLEDLAYILPQATPTTFDLSGNGRMWFEFLQKRLCKKYVQREHYELALAIYKEICDLGKKYKEIYKHAIPCQSCGMCK